MALTRPMVLTRPPLFATLCALVGIAVLCVLGSWQVQRLAWKTTLLDTMHIEITKDATLVNLTAQDIPRDVPSSFFKRGTFTGIFDDTKTLYFGPYNQEGVFVYHVYTPMILQDDHAIWVKRGYTLSNDAQKSLSLKVNKAAVRVSGHMKPVRSGARLQKITGIKNQPNINKWHFVDLAQMNTTQGLRHGISDVVFIAESLPAGEGSDLNMNDAEIALPNNNHLQYASFWFAMSCALVVVFGLRFCIKKAP